MDDTQNKENKEEDLTKNMTDIGFAKPDSGNKMLEDSIPPVLDTHEDTAAKHSTHLREEAVSSQRSNELQKTQYDGSERSSRLIIIFSVIIAAISAYILLAVDLPNKPIAGRGGIDENTAAGSIGGDFVLTDYNGNHFSSDQLKGSLSLVYFGFTYCPDICPTSLQKISKALGVLGKYNIDVTPVFITVDPDRDKIATLKEYLGHFNQKIIGLTGSDSEIASVATKFKVYYAKSGSDAVNDGNDHYMIDHSSFIYLMDKNFRYIKHFYMDNTAEEIIEDIRLNQ